MPPFLWIAIAAALLLGSRKSGGPQSAAQSASQKGQGTPPQKTIQPAAKKGQGASQKKPPSAGKGSEAASKAAAKVAIEMATAERAIQEAIQARQKAIESKTVPFDANSVDLRFSGPRYILQMKEEYKDYLNGTLEPEEYPVQWHLFLNQFAQHVAVIKVNPGKWIEIVSDKPVKLSDVIWGRPGTWDEWLSVGVTAAGLAVVVGPELLAAMGIAELGAAALTALTITGYAARAGAVIVAANKGVRAGAVELASQFIPVLKFADKTGVKKAFVKSLGEYLFNNDIKNTFKDTLNSL